MISLKERSRGFTVVELLIVMGVIVILSLFVLKTFSGIQAKTRNVTRQKNILSIQSAVEKYFSQNGYYPSLGDINNAKWRVTNMKTLSNGDMVDPLSNCNPAATACIKPAPLAKYYSYAVSDNSGKSCELTDTDCGKYTLTATYEGTVDGSKRYTKINID